jgi:uncharacterized protein
MGLVLKRWAMSTVEANVRVVLEAFRAVERRDAKGLAAVCQPDVEFHWPPSLPYGGSHALTEEGRGRGRRFEDIWGQFQPTSAERSMDPRVVAASEREVVVLWRQRGVRAQGVRLDSPVLGLYEVRDGRLARAQMFYFDPVAVEAFLEQGSI